MSFRARRKRLGASHSEDDGFWDQFNDGTKKSKDEFEEDEDDLSSISKSVASTSGKFSAKLPAFWLNEGPSGTQSRWGGGTGTKTLGKVEDDGSKDRPRGNERLLGMNFSLPTMLIGALVAVYGLLSVVLGLFFRLIGFPLQSLMPPAILISVTIAVLIRPGTLASFLCTGVNLVLGRVLGLKTYTEIGRIDLLKRRIEALMVYHGDVMIFSVNSVELEFSSRALNPFHGPSRPLLTLMIKGVTINLFHSFIQEMMMISKSKKTKPPENQSSEDETNTVQKDRAKQAAREKRVNRLIWMSGFVIIEINKVVFRFVAGETVFDISTTGILLSCSKQDHVAIVKDGDTDRSNVVDMLVIPHLSVSTVTVNLSMKESSYPLFYTSNFCFSVGIVRHRQVESYRRRIKTWWCSCVLSRLEMTKSRSTKKTSDAATLEKVFIGMDFVDVFVFRGLIDAVDMAKRSVTPGTSENMASHGQTTEQEEEMLIATAKFADLKAAERIELSQKMKTMEHDKALGKLGSNEDDENESRDRTFSDVSTDSEGWECRECSFLNSPLTDVCSVCKSRSSTYGRTSSFRSKQPPIPLAIGKPPVGADEDLGTEDDENDEGFENIDNMDTDSSKAVGGDRESPSKSSMLESAIGAILHKLPKKLEFNVDSLLLSLQGDAFPLQSMQQNYVGGSARLQTSVNLYLEIVEEMYGNNNNCASNASSPSITGTSSASKAMAKGVRAHVKSDKGDVPEGSGNPVDAQPIVARSLLFKHRISDCLMSIQPISFDKFVLNHLSLRESENDLLHKEFLKFTVFSVATFASQICIDHDIHSNEYLIQCQNYLSSSGGQPAATDGDDALNMNDGGVRGGTASMAHTPTSGDSRNPLPDHDWECNSCSYVNDAEQSVCTVCNAPYQTTVVRAPEWDLSTRQGRTRSTSSLSSFSSAGAGVEGGSHPGSPRHQSHHHTHSSSSSSRMIPRKHHHETRASCKLILSQPIVQINITCFDCISSFKSAFFPEVEIEALNEELQDEKARTDDESTFDSSSMFSSQYQNRHQKHKSSPPSIISDSGKSSSQPSNKKLPKKTTKLTKKKGKSQRVLGFISEVLGVSYNRYIDFTFDMDKLMFTILQRQQQQQQRRRRSTGVSMTLNSFQASLSMEHFAPPAIDSWTWRKGTKGKTSTDELVFANQRMSIKGDAEVGPFSLSQDFIPSDTELVERIRVLGAQWANPGTHDTSFGPSSTTSGSLGPIRVAMGNTMKSHQVKPATTTKNDTQSSHLRSFRLLHIPGATTLSVSLAWEKGHETPRDIMMRLSNTTGLKFHGYFGSWLRIAGLAIDYREEFTRCFPTEEKPRPKRKSSSTKGTGFTSAGAASSNISSGRYQSLGNDQVDVKAQFGKISIYVYGHEGLGFEGHVFRLYVPEITVNQVDVVNQKADFTIVRTSLALAKQKPVLMKVPAAFSTILKIDTIKTGVILEQTSDVVQSTIVSLTIGTIRIIQGPNIEFGEALQAVLQQRKAFRYGLAAMFGSSSGPIPSKSQAKTSKSANAHQKQKVQFIKVHLSLTEAVIRFRHDDSSFQEDPELLKYAPKKNSVPHIAVIHANDATLKLTWDSRVHSRPGLLDLLWKYDDCPTTELASIVHKHGFSFIMGCTVDDIMIKHLTFQLRNHRRPMVEAWSISTFAPSDIVIAELRGTSACTSETGIVLSEAFPAALSIFGKDGTIRNRESSSKYGSGSSSSSSSFSSSRQPVSNHSNPVSIWVHPFGLLVDRLPKVGVPTKLYFKINLCAEQLNVTHGECLTATMNAFDVALARSLPKSSDKRSPKLGFWDKLRYMYHGLLSIRAKRGSVRILTLSPWHGDTGLLLRGTNLTLRNIRGETRKRSSGPGSEQQQQSQHLDEKVKGRPRRMSAVYSTTKDLMDWGNFFSPFDHQHSDNAGSTAGSKRSSQQQHQQPHGQNGMIVREWELFVDNLTLSTIRDNRNQKVDQFTLLTVPRARVQLSLGWGGRSNLDHYVQFHHPVNATPGLIDDMYKKFRSHGLELGLKFELGCTSVQQHVLKKRGQRQDQTQSYMDTTPQQTMNVDNTNGKSDVVNDEEEVDEEESCDFPALTVCWASYVAICDVLRAFSPPGPPKTGHDKATFGRLLTHLKIGILADRPRVLWWEEPRSEAALLAHASSLLTKIEYVRERNDQWNPPYGIPPKWQQHALLVQCPNVEGYFIPRATPPSFGAASTVLLEGRTYVDASGCGWRYWSAFPVPPRLNDVHHSDKKDEGMEPVEYGFPDEPFVSSPAFMLKAGNWRHMQASTGPYSWENDEYEQVFTIVLDECRLTWTINIRDAIFMVIGSTLYAIRQQLRIDERLKEEHGELSGKNQHKHHHQHHNSSISRSTSSERRPTRTSSERDVFGVQRRKSSSASSPFMEEGEEDARPRQFDGHFEGPLVDFARVYSPLQAPSLGMANLLARSAPVDFFSPDVDPKNPPRFKPGMAFAENYKYEIPHENEVSATVHHPSNPSNNNPQSTGMDDSFVTYGQYNNKEGILFAEGNLDDVNEQAHRTEDDGEDEDAGLDDSVEDNIGELSFVVRLRWAQVHLRTGKDTAFVVADSADIRTYRQMLDVFSRHTGDLMSGFEMLRREVDVEVCGAQVFVAPVDQDLQKATPWIPIRQGFEKLCFTETLRDYAFCFHDEAISTTPPLRGERQYFQREDIEDQGHRPVLVKMDFKIRETTYTLFPPDDESILTKESPEDADFPLGKFIIDLPHLEIRLGSVEFFHVLGIVRNLLLVMPSPDYTAMIKTEVTEEDVKTTQNLRWFGNMDNVATSVDDAWANHVQTFDFGEEEDDIDDFEPDMDYAQYSNTRLALLRGEVDEDDYPIEQEGYDSNASSPSSRNRLGRVSRARDDSMWSEDLESTSPSRESSFERKPKRGGSYNDDDEDEDDDEEEGEEEENDAYGDEDDDHTRFKSSDSVRTRGSSVSGSSSSGSAFEYSELLLQDELEGKKHRRKQKRSGRRRLKDRLRSRTRSSSSSRGTMASSIASSVEGGRGAGGESTTSSVRSRRGASVLETQTAMITEAEADLAKSSNDLKVLQKLVDSILNNRGKQRKGKQTELIYSIGEATLILLGDKPSNPVPNRKHGDRYERVHMLVWGLRGSHVFGEDGSTRVQVSLHDLRIVDCHPTTGVGGGGTTIGASSSNTNTISATHSLSSQQLAHHGSLQTMHHDVTGLQQTTSLPHTQSQITIMPSAGSKPTPSSTNNASKSSKPGTSSYQDILRGNVVNVGSSNAQKRVPILRIDASTQPHILLGAYKVNVYDMLQILFYPGAPAYRLSVYLHYETAMFLVKYFNSEGEDDDDVLLLSPNEHGGTSGGGRPVAGGSIGASQTSSTNTHQHNQQQQQVQRTIQPTPKRQSRDDLNESTEMNPLDEIWIIRAGWIAKRGRADISWLAGRVRRNFCHLRIRMEPNRVAVLFEYFRSELETKFRIPPRGSIDLAMIKKISFTDDETAPRHALDVEVFLEKEDAINAQAANRKRSRTGESVDTITSGGEKNESSVEPRRTISYTFAPAVTSRRNRTLDTRKSSVEWVAAMKPMLSAPDVISNELTDLLNDDVTKGHYDDISETTARIVSHHRMKLSGRGGVHIAGQGGNLIGGDSSNNNHNNKLMARDPNNRRNETTSSPGYRPSLEQIDEDFFELGDLLHNPQQYMIFIRENENRRYLLSTQRASALGLMTPEAVRLASGQLLDLVYLRNARTSPIYLNLGCHGFPILGKRSNRLAECPSIIIQLKLLTWQKFFKQLKNKIARHLLTSLALGGRNKHIIEDAQPNTPISSPTSSGGGSNASSPYRKRVSQLKSTSFGKSIGKSSKINMNMNSNVNTKSTIHEKTVDVDEVVEEEEEEEEGEQQQQQQQTPHEVNHGEDTTSSTSVEPSPKSQHKKGFRFWGSNK